MIAPRVPVSLACPINRKAALKALADMAFDSTASAVLPGCAKLHVGEEWKCLRLGPPTITLFYLQHQHNAIVITGGLSAF